MSTVTVQQTGKDVKILMLLSKVMFWVGLPGYFYLVTTNPEVAGFAALAFCASLPTYVVGKVINWWKYS